MHYTAGYKHIQYALDAHEVSFAALEAEMDAFEPLARESFNDAWKDLWQQMRPLNPHLTDAQLKHYIDGQIDVRASRDVQIFNAFYARMAAESVSVTVLSHALLEAVINAVLALGLFHTHRAGLFRVLESSPLKSKWEFGPQSFMPSYGIDRSGALYEVLGAVCKQRNDIAHSKIALHDDQRQLVLEGSGRGRLGWSKGDRGMLRRFLTLPYALHENLVNQIQDPSLRFTIAQVLKRSHTRRA